MSCVSYRELIEVAGLLAAGGSPWRAANSADRDAAIHRLLQLSKARLRDWLAKLAEIDEHCAASPWSRCRDLAEEVLISELSARVVATLLVERRASQEAVVESRRVGQQLLADVLLARHAALTRLLACGAPVGTLSAVNQLRRRMERWTDLLLAMIGSSDDRGEFAFDAERVREARAMNDRDRAHLSRLLTSGMLPALPRRCIAGASRAGIQRAFMQTMISLLAAPGTAGGVLPRSPLQWRIANDHTLSDRRASAGPAVPAGGG